MNEGGNNTVREKGPGGKLIMDHRCWEELKKLSNYRSGFWDWKVRFKDALNR